MVEKKQGVSDLCCMHTLSGFPYKRNSTVSHFRTHTAPHNSYLQHSSVSSPAYKQYKRYSGWIDTSSQLPYLNTFTCTFNYVFPLLNYIFSKNKQSWVDRERGGSEKSWGLCVNIIKTGTKLETPKELNNIPYLSNMKTTRLKI